MTREMKRINTDNNKTTTIKDLLFKTLFPFDSRLRLMVCCLIAIVAFVFFAPNSFAQNNDPDIDGELQAIIELLIEQNEELAQYDTYIENLTDLSSDKINLNKADYEEIQRLKELGIISDSQLNNLLDYRDEMGELFNKYELQAVPGWDLNTIRRAMPFVRVGGEIDAVNINLKELLFEGDNQLFMRYSRVLEKQEGYKIDPETGAPTYLGNPDKLYMRFRHKYGSKISYGVTAEKDPGEQFFKGAQKNGFDFYSAHFYMRDVGPLKRLIVGDFQVTLGQGLMAWTGIGFGKSPFVMDIKRQGYSVNPYTSVNEALFFRGAALTARIAPKIDLTAFGSYKPIDVTFADSRDTFNIEELFASGISEAGLHRTETENFRRQNENITDVGAELKYKTRRLSVGVSGLYTKYSIPVTVRNVATNSFRFSGQDLVNVGLNYRYLVGNLHFFGETAMSDDRNGNRGFATLNGVLASLHPSVDMSIVYRHYARDYQSLYGDPFAESSTPVNEEGLFIGSIIKLSKAWSVQGYTDFYRHPWLRFRVDGPSYGHDKLIQVNYKPSRALIIYSRFAVETKGRNLDGDAEEFTDYRSDAVEPHKRQLVRLDLRYKLNKEVTLKSRVDGTSYEDGFSPKERGYLLYQELTYQPLNSPFSFDVRYTLFDIDNWDARIYAYEKDVLYAFSIPPYSNRGRRFYAVLRYNLSRKVTVWGRFARTTYDDRNTVGSGNEQVDGPTRTDVKLQMRIKF